MEGFARVIILEENKNNGESSVVAAIKILRISYNSFLERT